MGEAELIAALDSQLQASTAWLLGLDGEQGVGKTALALRLAAALGAEAVHCDDFVTNGRLAYPHIADLAGVASKVEEFRADGRPVILEGVMLGLVIEAAKLQPNATIYVRHVLSNGRLKHPHLFDPDALQAEIDREEAIDQEFFPDRKHPCLPREILAYHLQRRPSEAATYILENRFRPG